MYAYTQLDEEFSSWCISNQRLSRYGAGLLKNRIFVIKQYLSQDELLSSDCFNLATMYRERKGDRKMSRDCLQIDRRAIRFWQEFSRTSIVI